MLNLRPSKLNNMQEKSAERSFVRLLKIMDELREKCPWDRKQTMNSLRYLSIEEIYELSDAIVEKNNDEIKKELGDLLLHIVFYARIASESDTFDISDVINTVCDKLVYRHPHIYGEVKVANDVEVKENWEKLKLKEGKESVLEGVPNSLPSMIKAFRIQEKVRGVGFDWNDTSQVFDKVKEELNELQQEIERQNTDRIESEFGDLFFSLINYARFVNINPDDALEICNRRFINRFQIMENKLKKEGKDLSVMKLEEMEKNWELPKQDYLNT